MKIKVVALKKSPVCANFVTECASDFDAPRRTVSSGGCSALMKPDTHLGENARQIEVSDDQTTSFLARAIHLRDEKIGR
ncbi:hypothetical protein [Pseudomonas fluorescens]|uniref:hypothetical protein n=1 Tax=Pseudomonas fluorescens TaxID=294 RepID=UPI0017842FD4|nr:hypothetical protein [Pseudomonas fluorescens]